MKTVKHMAGYIFSNTSCILVKIHGFGEQMVFQHGTICNSADGRLLGFCFVLFCFNFNLTTGSKTPTGRLLKNSTGSTGFKITFKKKKKKLIF